MKYEKRREPRYFFSATAEVSMQSSRARIGRVKDLSASGSYVAISNPFSKGAAVWIAIHTETATFQCEARVASSTEGIGMGLEFGEISPSARIVLQNWIRELE